MAGILLLGSGNSVFNNGRSQLNFNDIKSGSGEFAFANLMKIANLQGVFTPDNCDTNGYPTTGGGSWSTSMPSQNQRPGSYYLRWKGTGVASFTITGGMTLNSGSLTPSAGVGFAEVTPNSATTGPQGNAVIIGFNNPAQDITFCHNQDDAAVQANPNEFHPKFMEVVRALKPGVVRFFNWFNGQQSATTDWASRAPSTYVTFAGSPLEKNNYAGVGVWTGTDIAVSTPPGGFTLQDKARLQYYVGTASPAIVNSGKTGAFTNTQTNITATAHSLATGNQVYLGGASIPAPFTGVIGSVLGGATAVPVTPYFVTVIDPDTITLSATSGGSAITCSGSGSCTLFGYVTISVGGGAKTPIFNGNLYPYPMGFLNFPGAGAGTSLRVLIYDATFGAFCNPFSIQGGSSVPPEVCLDLCHKIGAHPWFSIPQFACDPATDLTTKLGELIRDTYQNGKAPWMVPRIEVSNETWNNALSGGPFQYSNRKATYYGWSDPANNWMGKAGSILGQTCANVWGYGNKGIKYHSCIGVQTTTGTDQNFGTGTSRARFNSTQFMTSDPNPVQSPYTRTPAFVWCSHLSAANYVVPSDNTDLGVVTNGYNYTVTNAGNPTAQAVNVGDYVDTLAGATLRFNNAAVLGFFTNWVAFGQGVTQSQTKWTYNAVDYTFAVNCYEGGYSPDYGGSNGAVSPITGAVVTSGTTVDLTLATTSIQGNTARTGNPAIAGMYHKISSVGGMTQLNGNNYLVSGVSGNTVTITVPSTAGFGAYTSGGSATYFQDSGATISADVWIQNMRGQGKLCVSSALKPANGLGGHLTDLYNGLVAANVEFPSCFMLGDVPPPPSNDVWSILNDIYQPFATSPQAVAIQAYNS